MRLTAHTAAAQTKRTSCFKLKLAHSPARSLALAGLLIVRFVSRNANSGSDFCLFVGSFVLFFFASQRCLLLLSGPSSFTLHLDATSQHCSRCYFVFLFCFFLGCFSHLVSHQQSQFACLFASSSRARKNSVKFQKGRDPWMLPIRMTF